MNGEYLRPVFVISVAAQLADMHPQTLRQYDRIGLVSPSRQSGKQRRYDDYGDDHCHDENDLSDLRSPIGVGRTIVNADLAGARWGAVFHVFSMQLRMGARWPPSAESSS